MLQGVNPRLTGKPGRFAFREGRIRLFAVAFARASRPPLTADRTRRRIQCPATKVTQNTRGEFSRMVQRQPYW